MGIAVVLQSRRQSKQLQSDGFESANLDYFAQVFSEALDRTIGYRSVPLPDWNEMSKVLTPESVATRPDASYFSPEKLAMLKRIFDAVCKEEHIVSKEHRDKLAAKLLLASKQVGDETSLVAIFRNDIASFKK